MQRAAQPARRAGCRNVARHSRQSAFLLSHACARRRTTAIANDARPHSAGLPPRLAIEAADCTASPGLTRIAIAPGAIKFYEGRSEVVSADAPHDGALVLQITHTAEGQTSNETHVLALDEAKTTLTYKRDDNTFTYRRCD